MHSYYGVALAIIILFANNPLVRQLAQLSWMRLAGHHRSTRGRCSSSTALLAPPPPFCSWTLNPLLPRSASAESSQPPLIVHTCQPKRSVLDSRSSPQPLLSPHRQPPPHSWLSLFLHVENSQTRTSFPDFPSEPKCLPDISAWIMYKLRHKETPKCNVLTEV